MRIQEIYEALKPSEYRDVVKGWDKNKLAAIFASAPYKKDRNMYRIYMPVNTPLDVEPLPEIEEELQQQGYEVKDYVAGLAEKNGRVIKIGKLLSPDTLRQYEVDKRERVGKRRSFHIVISRHPYDIAGMSTDRGWTSCQDLRSGSHCHFVPKDIEAGSFIAYLADVNDTNLKNPTARVLIKPYVNTEGQVAYASSRQVYGSVPSDLSVEFTASVDKFVRWINSQHGLTGVFDIHQEVYPEGEKTIDLGVENLVATLTADKFNQLPDETKLKVVKHSPKLVKTLPITDTEFLKTVAKEVPEVLLYVKNPSIELQTSANLSAEVLDNFKFTKINANEQEQLKLVNKDPFFLRFIENPSDAALEAAVAKEPTVIRIIKNPSYKLQHSAVSTSYRAIAFIKNPDVELQRIAIEKSRLALLRIENVDPEIQKEVVKKNPTSIGLIRHPTEEACNLALDQNIGLIRDINNPTEAVQLRVVNYDPDLIEYIKRPSINVQLAAVKKNYNSIRFIPRPSLEVQLAAIEVSENAIKFIRNPHSQAQVAAVRKNVEAISLIRNPDERAQIAATEDSILGFQLIENPTKRVIALYHKLYRE